MVIYLDVISLTRSSGVYDKANNLCVIYLASGGVCMAPIVTNRSVSSYLALSTLPHQIKLMWRYISVVLSLKLPSPAVNRHPVLRCSDFPRGFLPATIWLTQLYFTQILCFVNINCKQFYITLFLVFI